MIVVVFFIALKFLPLQFQDLLKFLATSCSISLLCSLLHHCSILLTKDKWNSHDSRLPSLNDQGRYNTSYHELECFCTNQMIVCLLSDSYLWLKLIIYINYFLVSLPLTVFALCSFLPYVNFYSAIHWFRTFLCPLPGQPWFCGLRIYVVGLNFCPRRHTVFTHTLTNYAAWIGCIYVASGL